MERLLILGSEGFIGRHIYYELVGSYEIYRADTRFLEADDYMRTDVTHFEELQQTIEWSEPDIILNLAGEYGILNGEEHPVKCFDVNATALVNLCLLCLRNGIRLVHLSTGDVYGAEFDMEVDEYLETPITSPKNIYSLSKLAGEGVINLYRRNYGLNANIIRPFMIYGPGEPPSKFRSAMVRMCDAAAHGDTFYANAGAERAWLHVKDFARAIRMVLYDGFGDYNIGSDDYREIYDTAMLACKLAERGKVELVEPPDSLRAVRKRVDFSRIRGLGWEPKIPLEYGIGEVVGWCRTYMGSPRNSEEASRYAEDAREALGLNYVEGDV